MKTFKKIVVVLALSAMIPLQVFAQNKQPKRCYNPDCVFEILKQLLSDNDSVVAKSELDITEVVDYYRFTGDGRIKDALKSSIIPFVGKFGTLKSNPFLISQLPSFCNRYDIEDIAQLIDNENVADCAIRAIGDIKGSSDFIMKYIERNHDNLRYKAALANAVGKQKIASLENELVSWLDDADDNTKIEIYNALLVIKSNENTEKIIEKGAKKLYKSSIAENKIAGMRLSVALKGEDAMGMLYKALKNDNRDVRVEALELMKPFANQTVVKKVMKKCKKDDALVDAVNWLGDIKNDSQMELLVKLLSSDNKKVVEAAIRAIFKIDNIEGMNAVKPMFGGVYQDVIKESAVAYEGDFKALINDMMRVGNSRQKLACLQIVESRPETALYMRVQEMTSSDNQNIRDLAFKVLKDVVTAPTSDFLKGLLEYCDDKYVEDVQLAIKNAMKNVPNDRKDLFVTTLKHVRSDIMPRYYKVFAYFGTEVSVEKLIDAYQNGAYPFDAKEALLLVENEAYKERINEVLNN